MGRVELISFIYLYEMRADVAAHVAVKASVELYLVAQRLGALRLSLSEGALPSLSYNKKPAPIPKGQNSNFFTS